MARGLSLGRYVVVDQVGQGGMGVVVRAYDPRLHREVALKRLRVGALSERAEARLLREAQAMAQLNHPNVVSVYDVETIGDGVVLAMEFVDGQTLRQWLATPRTRPQIVASLRAAGRGLEAAHRVGLVHRDFKPSNVLVGHDGRVLVTDFGLARGDVDATESLDLQPTVESSRARLAAPLTEAGTVMGTPAYMAPEQHMGEPVDARSDQYAFCVAAWEALCGERPFEATSGETMVSLKVQGPPSRSGTPLPRWLYDVLRRGLAPHPADRWASMGELLVALGRDPGRRRRRAMAAAVGVAAVAGVTSMLPSREPLPGVDCASSAFHLRGLWDEATQRRVHEAFAGSGVPAAPMMWERVRAGLGDYASRWADARTASCVATFERGEQSERDHAVNATCLRERRGHLEAAIDVLASADAGLVLRASEVVGRLPDLSYCEDVERFQTAVPVPDDAQVADAVAAIRARAGKISALRWAGRDEEALALADDLLARAGALDYPPVEAELRGERGVLLDELGRWEEGKTEQQRAYAISMRAGHDRVAAASAAALAAVTGETKTSLGEGSIWAMTALALVERVDADARTKSLVLNTLASFELERGDYDAAMDYYQRALVLREQLDGPRSPSVAMVLSNIGIVYDQQGEYRHAETRFRRVLSIDREALGALHPRVAQGTHDLAICLQLQGRYPEAEEVMREAVSLRERAQGSEHPEVVSARNDLAWVVLEQGRVEDAVPMFVKNLALAERVMGSEHLWVARIAEGLAGAYYFRGDDDAAEPIYQRALRIRRASSGADDRRLNYSLAGLGRIAHRRGDNGLAVEYLREALRVTGEQESGRRDRADVLIDLALAERGLGRDAVAAEHLARSIGLIEQIEGPRERLAQARFELARVRWRSRAREPAARLEVQALVERARLDAEAAGPAGAELVEQIGRWRADHLD